MLKRDAYIILELNMETRFFGDNKTRLRSAWMEVIYFMN